VFPLRRANAEGWNSAWRRALLPRVLPDARLKESQTGVSVELQQGVYALPFCWVDAWV
jgi:hypothetical protein